MVNLVLFFYCLTAVALRCDQLTTPAPLRSDLGALEIQRLPNGPGFIKPNEPNPRLLKPDLATADEGIYVTVGTERGFITAALMGAKAKALILVDRDPRVALYNLINRTLLVMAKSRDHYLQLRLKADYSEIQNLINSEIRMKLSNEDLTSLSNRKVWEWWQENVQKSDHFNDFHNNPQQNLKLEFSEANYLFDDVLFNNIASLARQNRIIILQENISSQNFLERIADLARHINEKIAVLDLSNAWQEGYLGHQATLSLLQNFKTLFSTNASFVLSFLANNRKFPGTSTFYYMVQSIDSLDNSQTLHQMMSQLEMQDPSRSRPRERSIGRGRFSD